MTQSSNDRFVSPLGLTDDGKPWKEEDIPWELDKDGLIVMKKTKGNTGNGDSKQSGSKESKS